MERLDPAEVEALAASMVETGWAWRIEELDDYLAALGLSRDRTPGDFPELVMLPLRGDRIPGQAGMVHVLASGDVISVSASLTDGAARDDQAGQTQLDEAAAGARTAITGRFGRPKAGKTPTWTLEERQLELHRLAPVLRLTLVHLANRAISEGK